MSDIELLLAHLREGEPTVFAKGLARNDHSWADDPGKHQAGVYVPASIRESNFLPELRQRGDKPHIYDVEFAATWPQLPDYSKELHLVHYSNKGPETHLTRVPKQLFKELGPSSLLVVIKKKQRDRRSAYALFVFDSNSDEYDLAIDILGLPPTFEFGLVQIEEELGPEEKLIAIILKALREGQLGALISRSALPSGNTMALAAQGILRERHAIESLNPYLVLPAPGDALIELTEIEYSDFRARELKLRAAQLAAILVGRHGPNGDEHLVRSIVTGFSEIADLFKSIRGARASRAGTSFELHIRQMLTDGSVPFDYQQLIGSRSPDFILPSLRLYNARKRNRNDVMILSAKTTLRERWQQILNEGAKLAEVFLATLDQTVSASTLRDLSAAGIHLVVPERYTRAASKGHQKGVYYEQSNVVSFRSFFDQMIRRRQHAWSTL